MSRSQSATAIQALMAQETGQVFLILLELTHDDLAAPIFVVQNTEPITHNGNTYVDFPFEITPPGEGTNADSATLTICNVDRSITDAIRSISSPVDVVVKVVLASSPDTIEYQVDGLRITDVEYDSITVDTSPAFEDWLNAAYPAGTHIPKTNKTLR